jgi:hypothetical protein
VIDHLACKVDGLLKDGYISKKPYITSTIQKHKAAIRADKGIVSTQAQTTVLATPHLTADNRRTAPTPTIAPVIV